MSNIKYENGQIFIDAEVLLEGMSKEDQAAFVKQFSVQRDVIENVIAFICGEDPEGWWSSYTDEDRMKMFKRVEQAHLKKWSRYNWRFIEEAVARLKEIREKERLYWALYHGPFREELWDHFNKFCKANNITSEYTTEHANKDIERVIDIVTDALKGLVDETKETT